MTDHIQRNDASRYVEALCSAHQLNNAQAFQDNLYILKEYYLNPLLDKGLASIRGTTGNRVFKDKDYNLKAVCDGIKIDLKTFYSVYYIYYTQGHKDSLFAASKKSVSLFSDKYLQKICKLFSAAEKAAEKSDTDPNYKAIGDHTFKFAQENSIHPPYTAYDNHNDFIRTDNNKNFTVRCSGREHHFKFDEAIF